MATPAKGRRATPAEPILSGHTIVVDSACPLDCPDACSLSVTLQHGKIVKIDGSNRQPVTGGYICAKVRKFDQVVYGDDRLLYPAVRKGRKGEGKFKRVPWDEALELVAEKMRAAKASHGGASILPYSYGGSNGLMTQDNIDAQLWRRFGTSRLARTVCAAPTGAANMALYGKMASVSYQDYPDARLIILWGVNPSTSGIHLVPYVREAQSRGAKLVVVDPRNTPLARSADVHLAVRPGSDVAVALAIHRISSPTASPTTLSCATTPAVRIAFASAPSRGRLRGPRKPRAWMPRLSSRSRGSTRKARPLSSAAGGGSNATATAATRRWPSFRCHRSAASSVCGAAAIR